MIRINTTPDNNPIMFQMVINWLNLQDTIILLYDVEASVTAAYKCDSPECPEFRRCLHRGLKQLPTFFLQRFEFEEVEEEVSKVLVEGLKEIKR